MEGVLPDRLFPSCSLQGLRVAALSLLSGLWGKNRSLKRPLGSFRPASPPGSAEDPCGAWRSRTTPHILLRRVSTYRNSTPGPASPAEFSLLHSACWAAVATFPALSVSCHFVPGTGLPAHLPRARPGPRTGRGDSGHWQPLRHATCKSQLLPSCLASGPVWLSSVVPTPAQEL